MLPHNSLCDVCKRNVATVFVTRIVKNHSNKQRLCQYCARRNAASEYGLKAATPKIGDGSVPSSIALDDVVKELFQQMKNAESNGDLPPALPSNLDFHALNFGNENDEESHDTEEFDSEDVEDESDISDDELDNIFQEMESAIDDVLSEDSEALQPETLASPREIVSSRCPKCATTWDRLRQDGRAGCSQCYEAFHDKLVSVMEQMQHEAQHTGKLPRAALKRQRRLEHLRTKRDHRLEMLKRRLKEAIAEEKYEDAVHLRDKIKIVESTIVSQD